MSQTVDSPLKTLIPGAFNGGGGKDKLLKLAESNKNKEEANSSHNSSSKKSKKSKKNNKSAADSSLYDLAFTSNIEHLAIRDHNISQRSSTPIDSSFLADSPSNNNTTSSSATASPNRNKDGHNSLNLSCDSPTSSPISSSSSSAQPCECIAHTTSLLDTISCSGPSQQLHHQFSEVLNLSDTTQSFTSPCSTSAVVDGSNNGAADLFASTTTATGKSRIPQSVDRRRMMEFNRVRSLNRWPDTDDLSTTTNTATASSSGKMTGFGSDNPDRIAKWHDTYQATTISSGSGSRLPQSSSGSSSSSQLTQARLQQQFHQHHQHQQQQQQTSYQKMVKSRSHNFLQRKGGLARESSEEGAAVYFPSPAMGFFGSSSSFDQPGQRRAELFADDFHFPQQQQPLGKPRLETFVIDEDHPTSFINSPKRIEVTHSATTRSLQPSSLLANISTPEQAQYDRLFLRESQKSALTSITSESAQEGCKATKSNSCDSLGQQFSQRSLSKPKSETDLAEAQRNDLTRILHLEEQEAAVVEEETVLDNSSGLNRFFNMRLSLRPFSKHHRIKGISKTVEQSKEASTQQAPTPLTSADSSTSAAAAASEFLTINEGEEVIVSESSSIFHQQHFSSATTTTTSDINQNRISFTNLQGPMTSNSSEVSNHNFSFSSGGGSGNSSFTSTTSSSNTTHSHNIGKMSTIERRKSRADMFNRKSFRRSTTARKSGTAAAASAAATLRLKRSHSQPHDNNSNKPTGGLQHHQNQNANQLSQQSTTDRSVDSDCDGGGGGTKSPSSCHSSQADTAKQSGSELNDSQETTDEVIFAEAIWDYLTSDNEELNFRCGDLINVTDTSHKEWWWGAIKGQGELETRYGWFPASYVRLKVSQGETLEEALEAGNGGEEEETSETVSESEPNNNSTTAAPNTTITASPSSSSSSTPNQSDLIKSTTSSSNQNDATLTSSAHSVTTPVKKRMSMSSSTSSSAKMSAEQVRAKVVLEIVNTERDFVKNLKDVIDGYLKPCRDRTDMFDQARLATIFGNIEELYAFQRAFLAQLEASLNADSLAASEIGSVFLRNEAGFAVYGEFATNHPLAISELQDLYADTRYIVFFEGCRLLQNMIDISLDGFLLTPIQKICKYPLQLGELLKYTKADHPDHLPVASAYQCMQRVAAAVNERKRRFEALEALIRLQEAFTEGGSWEGPTLLDSGCSLLVHQGELTRLTGGGAAGGGGPSWSTRQQELTLLLFDRLLVLAKRDTGGLLLVKRSSSSPVVYQLKSRLPLEEVGEVVASSDGQPPPPPPTDQPSSTAAPEQETSSSPMPKNSFKFYNLRKSRWYLFQAKSTAERDRWVAAFAEARARVLEDEAAGFVVTERDKRCAQLAHANHLKPKRPARARRGPPLYGPGGHGFAKMKKPDTVIAEIPLVSLGGADRFDRNRAGSLPSYLFQGTGVLGGQAQQQQHQSILNGLKNGRQSTMHGKKSSSNWFQQLGSSKGSGGGGGGGSKGKMLKRNLK